MRNILQFTLLKDPTAPSFETILVQRKAHEVNQLRRSEIKLKLYCPIARSILPAHSNDAIFIFQIKAFKFFF